MYDDPAGDPTEDPAGKIALIRPKDFLPPHPFPAKDHRLGFDRFTGDNGALLAVAASLDSAKVSHRIVAWLLLLVVGMPVPLEVWQILR